MKITPKFEINNLVNHKFFDYKNTFNTESHHVLCALEVLFIHTETCSAGTQVFYDCRPIMRLVNKKRWGFDEKPDVTYAAAENTGNKFKEHQTVRYREDELVEADAELVKMILNKGDNSDSPK